MPSINKHRTYCKTCKDFTVHSKDYVCETCDTTFTPYFPHEVEQEKVRRQRERFRQWRMNSTNSLYNAFMMGVGLQAMMNSPQTNISECDAGQKEIDEQIKKEREARKKAKEEIREEYNLFYKTTQRNDSCPCGSGLKYKKCHLIYFRERL